jgi:hypothetical protein
MSRDLRSIPARNATADDFALQSAELWGMDTHKLEAMAREFQEVADDPLKDDREREAAARFLIALDEANGGQPPSVATLRRVGFAIAAMHEQAAR